MRQLKITQSITNRRESHTLEKYFTEVSGVPMITPDEEVRLAKQIKKGNQDALDKLVRANLRFVVSVAKQYQNRSLPLNDLINEGNLGLIKAAKSLMKLKDLSLFLMLFGGLGNLLCKHLQSNQEL